MRAIALGVACNNACVFCAQGDLRRTAGPRPDVDRQIAEIEPGEVVALVGGEPTLHDELPDWVRAADARGAARVIVQTNGRRLAYGGFIKALREASGKLSLDVSLHGSTAAMHDYHTGTPGSFEQTVTGLRRARGEHIPTVLTAVLTRSNFRHANDLVRVGHAVGVRALHFAFALSYGRALALRDRVIPSREMVAPYLNRALLEAQQLGIGTFVDDGQASRASARELLEFFAGIGEVEGRVDTATAPSPASRGRVALTVLGAQERDSLHESQVSVKTVATEREENSIPALRRSGAPGG